MGLIVHLTDLHLGPGGTSRFDDESKVPVLEDDERTSRRDTAEEELKRLAAAIKERRAVISAIVISGDVTVAGGSAGFSELKAFLQDAFGDLLPDDNRIVVVPGNHDVKWFEKDSAKRYADFVQHCFKSGYVTPPLEGVNLLGDPRRWTPDECHMLVDVDERWAILPINSAHFSGRKARLWDENGVELPDDKQVDALKAAVAGDGRLTAVLAQLLKLREFDMARVSNAQIKAFSKMAAAVRTKLGAGPPPLLLATLHHQLSPVDEREEIKAFETLSNLGRVRRMLQAERVNLVMHGHKHQSRVFWDSREDGSPDGRSRGRHDMLVVSGGTIGHEPGNPDRFANIIEIDVRPGGHDVRVRTLGEYLEDSDQGGARALFFEGAKITPSEVGGGFVEGASFDETYARLHREHDLVHSGRVNNLVVRIVEAENIGEPPAGYPKDAVGGSDDDKVELAPWFRAVAEWWQSPLIEAPEGLFTHGRRLKLHEGKNADQLKAIREIIKRDLKPTNGRAVATLVVPETDILPFDAAAPTRFPAFCLVQVYVTNDGSGDRLNATAYFRKQEMSYWWPVNVAEIRLIMAKVIEGMKDIRVGSITTVAALAVWQRSRSRVSIPMADRLYLGNHDGRTDLSRMIALVAGAPASAAGHLERERIRALWESVLDDIVPPRDSARDSIPVAVEGVRFLLRTAEAQSSVAVDALSRKRLATVISALQSLAASGEHLARLGAETEIDDFPQKLSKEVDSMSKARDDLIAVIAEMWPPPSRGKSRKT
jgi:3',5'-cyclic AMP phosphodiesterase CpdA